MEEVGMKKRGRDETEEAEAEIESQSPEVKRLREDLLDGLDDDSEFCTTSQDLDSFMKSFEEEIKASSPHESGGAPVDLTSESGESRPELGFLLEASDDELGLPPTTSAAGVEDELKTVLARVESDSSELVGEFWEIPSYDSFGFGFEAADNFNGGNGEYVALDGLFDYSDLGFGSTDFSWKPETLPAQ